MGLTFEWDERKAAANLRKHGISFEEAASAFGDPLSLTIPDADHSAQEERCVLLGMPERHPPRGCRAYRRGGYCSPDQRAARHARGETQL